MEAAIHSGDGSGQLLVNVDAGQRSHLGARISDQRDRVKIVSRGRLKQKKDGRVWSVEPTEPLD